MKRLLLICMIVGLCSLVAVSGNMALVHSNGIIKNQKQVTSRNHGCHILVDIADRRLFLLMDNQILKSYPVAVGDALHPSPIGNWRVEKVHKTSKSRSMYWLELDVPWGRYSIYGSDYSARSMFDDGSIKLFQDDLTELYNLVENETTAYVYNDEEKEFENINLKQGTKGSHIYEIEKRLRSSGYYVGKVDGIFDKDLETAIHKFQKTNKLVEADVIDQTIYTKLGMKILQ